MMISKFLAHGCRWSGIAATLLALVTAHAYSTTNAPLAGTDTDRDGLPDDLEIQFGSSPVLADTDGDKATDFEEYWARTEPRNIGSFPLFRNSVPPRQYLPGDTILLKPINVTNVIVYTNVVVEPIEVPPDAPPDAPTMRTNITLYPTFAVYQWLHDGLVLTNQQSLQLVRHMATVEDSGPYQLSAVIDYITGFATNSGLNEAGEVTNSVVTNFARASQLSAPISVQTLPLEPRVRVLQPAGTVVSWGNNAYKQGDFPAELTNGPTVLQVVAGRAHAAALLVDGTVTMWGANDVGQLRVPTGLFSIVSLAAGIDHTLALRSDGRVFAWGLNSHGQTNTPINATNVQSIAAGYFHSLAVLKDGRVVAWGANNFGQSTVPDGLTDVLQVVGGGQHSVALTHDGSVIAWGNPANNRLKIPSFSSRVVRLAAGDGHTVALTRDGDVFAWGDNTALQSSVPITLGKVLAITAGDTYAAVIGADGKFRAFGARGTLYADSADAVRKLPTTVTNAVAVSSGFFHVLGIVAPPDPDCDELSDEFEVFRALNPQNDDTDGDGLLDGIELRLGTNPLKTDTDRDGLDDLVEVVDEFDPTVATEAADGALKLAPAIQLDLFTLGRGNYQIETSEDGLNWIPYGNPLTPAKGLTSTLARAVSTQKFFRVIPPPGTSVTSLDAREAIANHATFGSGDAGVRAVPPRFSGLIAIAAGDWHSLGLRWDGTVVGWGVNVDGQTDIPPGLTDVVAIAAGGQHSLALRSDGTIIAWGRRAQGQTTVPTQLPVAQAISAGSDFSIALLTDGQVKVWGANDRGQASPPPTLGPVQQVDAGFAHVIALQVDGRVVCWGDNRFGQSNVPANLGPVVAVAAGDLHSIAIRADGSVVCWGNNSVGQCTPPANLGRAIRVDGGFRVSVALTEDGRVVAWGEGGPSLTPPSWLRNTTQISAGGFAIHALKNLEDADGDLVDDNFEPVISSDPQRGDSDGDGLGDGLEHIYGFNPSRLDAAAEPTLIINPAVELIFFTLSAGEYQLYSSTDLVDWRASGTPISGVRGYTSVLVASEGTAARYYRLVRFNSPSSP